MTKIVLLSLFVGFQAQAQEFIAPDAKEVVIGDDTYERTVDLNDETVICLQGDYSATSFKIAVPAIDDITYLDHTSPGAPGPCINAGFCRKTEDAQFSFGSTTDFRFPLFHDVSKPKEAVQIRVIRKEVSQVYGGKCHRYYMEHISATIRGTLFQHVASMPLSSGAAEMCD